MTTTHTNFNPAIYQGRAEPYEDALACYYYQHIQAYNHQPICLLGFACDQGVNRNQGRIGAKHAPDVLKSSLGKLPIAWQVQQKYPNLSNLIGDMGNIVCHDDDNIQENLLEDAQNHYAQAIRQIITNHSLPIAIGGGHEIAFASLMGLYHSLSDRPHTQNQRIGIINLDAHFDLRSDKYATSGTPFWQIAQFLQKHAQPFHYLTIGINPFANTASLFAKAQHLGVQIIDEHACHQLPLDDIWHQINGFIDDIDVIYLSLDLDVLPASVMPAVSAINSCGLSLDFVEKCLHHIIQSGKVQLIDVAEFNPNYDIDGRGAKVAGRILAGMIQTVLMQTAV